MRQAWILKTASVAAAAALLGGCNSGSLTRGSAERLLNQQFTRAAAGQVVGGWGYGNISPKGFECLEREGLIRRSIGMPYLPREARAVLRDLDTFMFPKVFPQQHAQREVVEVTGISIPAELPGFAEVHYTWRWKIRGGPQAGRACLEAEPPGRNKADFQKFDDGWRPGSERPWPF